MATAAGIKIPKKAPKRDPLFLDEKYTGTEPVWDTERALTFSDAEFDNHLRVSFKYYNYFYSAKDLKKYVVDWAKHNLKLTKHQLSLYTASIPGLTPITAGALIKAHLKGMPLKPRHVEYLTTCVMQAIEATAVEAPIAKQKNTKDVYTPTIQDRLNEKSAEIIGEIEGQVDAVFTNKPVTFKLYEFLTIKNVAQSQVGKIRAVFQKQIDELCEYLETKETQLKEAYGHLTKADIKRITDFYAGMMSDFDSYTEVKKATKKLRAPKPVSKEKQVAKVKYLKESKELKIVSVSPASILNATAVWVYNVKSRKIGKYVVDAHAGTLGIKGSTIIGFNEALSVAKTIRKPEEQLKEFLKLGKIALRTYLKDIKAVETKLNGRLSADILILKVET